MRIIIKGSSIWSLWGTEKSSNHHPASRGLSPLISPSIFNFLPHLFFFFIFERERSAAAAAVRRSFCCCVIFPRCSYYLRLCVGREKGGPLYSSRWGSKLPYSSRNIYKDSSPRTTWTFFFSFRLLWTPLFLTPLFLKKVKKYIGALWDADLMTGLLLHPPSLLDGVFITISPCVVS